MKSNNFYNILFYYKTFIIRSKIFITFFLIIIDLYIKLRLAKDYNNSKYYNKNGFTNLKKNKVQ